MLRVSFSNLTKAKAAVRVFEGYGYSAEQRGREVVTDCPTLLALPAIERRIGFADIERLDLECLDFNARADSSELTAEFPATTRVGKAQSSDALTN